MVGRYGAVGEFLPADQGDAALQADRVDPVADARIARADDIGHAAIGIGRGLMVIEAAGVALIFGRHAPDIGDLEADIFCRQRRDGDQKTLIGRQIESAGAETRIVAD